MKKSKVVERLKKPNYKEAGKENSPFIFYFKSANNTPIFYPKKTKRK